MVGVAERHRVLQRADAPRREDVLPRQVVGPVGLEVELDAGRHDVGEGLVERSRLALVDEPRRVVGDAVGQLVRDDVERAGEVVHPLAVQGDVGGKPVAVVHDAVAEVEGVDEEVRMVSSEYRRQSSRFSAWVMLWTAMFALSRPRRPWRLK